MSYSEPGWHTLTMILIAYCFGWVSARLAGIGRRGGDSDGHSGGGDGKFYYPAATAATARPARAIEQWPPPAAEEFEQSLASGSMVNAIRIYREQTGVSLGDARIAVERMAAERLRA